MKSMTAMGRAAGSLLGAEAVLELKSVNSKHRDLTLRLPKEYSCLEAGIPAALDAAGVLRGKLELTLTVNGSTEALPRPDPAAVETYLTMLRQLRDVFGLADDISVMQVAANRDLFVKSTAPADPDALLADFSPLLSRALADFNARRAAEGARLLADMEQKLAYIATCIEKIKTLTIGTVSAHRTALTARMREILAELGQTPDEGRLLTEAALFADRVAIDEELVRLSSHLVSFAEVAAGDAAGRKLDFLLQEMNREANTTGAKCADAAVALQVVEIKATLEKIREQVQNIE